MGVTWRSSGCDFPCPCFGDPTCLLLSCSCQVTTRAPRADTSGVKGETATRQWEPRSSEQWVSNQFPSRHLEYHMHGLTTAGVWTPGPPEVSSHRYFRSPYSTFQFASLLALGLWNKTVFLQRCAMQWRWFSFPFSNSPSISSHGLRSH